MSKTQTVCIDLPDERLNTNRQCSNLDVILRSYREVILDIDTGGGGKLKVQCPLKNRVLPKDKKYDRETSFYSNSLKKSINRGEMLTFNDGFKQTLRLSREFKGILNVYKGNMILLRIPVKEYDKSYQSSNPSDKPAPIMIRFNKNQGVGKNKINSNIDSWMGSGRMLPNTSNNVTYSGYKNYLKQDATIATVEVLTPVDIPNVPNIVWDHLGKGNKAFMSSDVDEYGVITNNWIYNQIGAASAYTADNWSWLKETVKRKADGGFKIVKVHFKKSKIKSGEKRLYVYFSGYVKSNSYFNKGVKHLSSNPVVMPLTAGAGSLSGMKSSIKQNVSSTFKNTALVYFILSSIVSVAEWKADQKADGYDLAGAIISNVIKAVLISAAITIMAAILFTTIASIAVALTGAVVVIPAIIIGVIYIILGVIAGFAIEKLDKILSSGDGLGKVISNLLRNITQWIRSVISSLNNVNTDEIWGDYQYGFL